MEDLTLIGLWKSFEKKLEKQETITRKNTEDLVKIRIKSSLSAMRPIKYFTLTVGILWVMAGGFIVTNIFAYAYSGISHFFLYSALVQLVLTALAIFIYIYQLILIQQVDISENIIQTQKKIMQLKMSTLWSARILFLQLPVWTTFYLSENMIRSGNIFYIIINGFITLLFTFFALWLFKNIHYRNREKKWFRLIFTGSEWTPIIKSMDMYKELEALNSEETVQH